MLLNLNFDENEINECNCKMSFCVCVFQPRGGLQMALKGHAGTLRQIHGQQIIPMEQAMVMPRLASALSRPNVHI